MEKKQWRPIQFGHITEKKEPAVAVIDVMGQRRNKIHKRDMGCQGSIPMREITTITQFEIKKKPETIKHSPAVKAIRVSRLSFIF